MTTSARIPVYLSRHTPNLPEPYGAMIAWEKGEKAITRKGGVTVTIRDPEMKWHNDAPVIDSARGMGRWVIEVIAEGESAPCAVSAASLCLTPEAMADWKARNTGVASTEDATRSVPHDIDNPMRPPLDPKRVQNALALVAQRMDATSYAVHGPNGSHHVTLRPHFSCDCADHIWRDSMCKHIIAALLAYGDPTAIKAASAAAREPVGTPPPLVAHPHLEAQVEHPLRNPTT